MVDLTKKCNYSNTSKIILFDFYSSHSIMGPPAPVQSLPQPPTLPNSSSLIQHPIHQNSYANSIMGGTSSSNSNMAPISSVNPCVKPERIEKLKDSLDFEIVEQLIIEHTEDKTKHQQHKDSVKRYDPKYRALTEAFRQMEDEDNRYGFK